MRVMKNVTESFAEDGANFETWAELGLFNKAIRMGNGRLRFAGS
jgi:hypothetical protein